MKQPEHGGGWQAIKYTWRKAREVGGWRLWKAMRSRNACKTCALGMGGQMGGMRNEAGHFPEFCKKSLQAMVADMRGKIEPRFFETYSLDQLKAFSPRELEMAGRLTQPLLAEPGSSHYWPIRWKEAVSIAAEAMRECEPDRAYFYASGRSSNEAGFLLQLLARAYGTNHVSNCSYYCHQASGAGLKDAIGIPTASIELEDLEKCDLVVLIGANPASNHPRLMATLNRLRERGGNVIVVNPLKEVGLVNFRVPSNVKSFFLGSPIASLYVQPKIGGDIALLTGVAKRLVELGQVEQEFVDFSTDGYEELHTFLSELSWEDVVSGSGVTREQIGAMADLYARSERAVFAWTMGITHHLHGVQNVQWIVNLALLRGMVGKPGAGVLPIRGHSNVQGMGSVGVMPFVSKVAAERLKELGLKPPSEPGQDPLTALEAAGRGEKDFLLCLGGNLFGASPDATSVREAFAKVETVVYLSTTLNTGHAHGLGKRTLILPVLARDEEPQSTTQESMFSYVRLSDGGPSRYDGPRSEVEILSEIADRAVGDVGTLRWRALSDHEAVRKLIAKLFPPLEAIEDIGRTKKEFVIAGRVLHDGRFPTPSGRAAFRTHPLPEYGSLQEDQLRLMTIRSEGQFNTVVYEEEDVYRGQERRDVILMNAKDMARMELAEGQWVEVIGTAGRSMIVRARPFDIAEGCAAMYYPESNVLIPKDADPRSRTPAFKNVLVSVRLIRGGHRELGEPLPMASTNGRPDSRKTMKAC